MLNLAPFFVTFSLLSFRFWLFLRVIFGKFVANMLQIMAYEKIILDTRRAKSDGSFPIRIYVRHRNFFLLSTAFFAVPDNFENGEYNKKENNYRTKNAALRNMLSQVVNEMLMLESQGKLKGMTDKAVKEHLSFLLFGAKKMVKKNFLFYLDEFVSKKDRPGTKTCYTTTRNKIVAFDKDCTFDSMDKKWLERFERSMLESGMKINAYAIHLRNIRAVFNYAIDNEYTTAYPFRKFKIKKEATRKRSLTIEQLRTLRDYVCEPYQVRYRDMFMLMFYLIGINAADLFLAKPSQLVNGRLEYKRAKTGKLYSILVHPEAMEIIDKYRGQDYLLNVMDEYKDYRNFLHRMGISLKEIGAVDRVGLGGRKVREPLFPDISSYWSRHTWATIAASLDIPKETISAALGHEIGSAVTSIYIDFDQRKVDEANRKVIDALR